jgi:drug/metabolite transporter (DMT)-like permease
MRRARGPLGFRMSLLPTTLGPTLAGPTLAGLGAVVLWSLLGLLTAGTGAIPPFQLTAMAFLLASGVGAVMIARTGVGYSVLRQPWSVWALGLYGLFGYHALYFTSQKLAPPAEAGLINSLWPLLIVLFSGLLPGERLRARHIIGAALGFGGIVVLALGRGGLTFSAVAMSGSSAAGYLAAFACALVWSSYSVLSRFHSTVPSEVVTGFCAVTAVLSLLCHLTFETAVWPESIGVWFCVLVMGIGPGSRRQARRHSPSRQRKLWHAGCLDHFAGAVWLRASALDAGRSVCVDCRRRHHSFAQEPIITAARHWPASGAWV